jgi:hypothetical protein
MSFFGLGRKIQDSLDHAFHFREEDVTLMLVPGGAADEVWRTGRSAVSPTDWKFAKIVPHRKFSFDVSRTSGFGNMGGTANVGVVVFLPLSVDGGFAEVNDLLEKEQPYDLVVFAKNEVGFASMAVVKAIYAYDSSVRPLFDQTSKDKGILHEELALRGRSFEPFKRISIDGPKN